jgi:toxin ParE1/3/4
VTKIELTLDAERDLIDIFLYGHAQAERYAETLNGKMAVVADNPSFGADYSFARDDLRRYECVSHAIY